MKKTILCIFLAIAMAFSFAACGEKTENTAPANTKVPSSENPAKTPAEEPAVPVFDISQVDTSDWIELDLSYATYLAAENPMGNLMYSSWIKKLEELMPGWVNITIYPSGTLLAQADTLEGVIAGVADIGFVDVSSHKEMLPETALWTLPNVHVSNTSAGTAAMEEWVTIVQPEELGDIVVLHAQCTNSGMMVTSFPVEGLSDLAGKQIRATAAFSELITSWGAIPVSVPTSELYEASRSGLIDGAYYTINANYIQGSHEFLKYAYFTNMCANPYLYVMNRTVFEQMPETQQAFFMEAIKEAFWELAMPNATTIGDVHAATLDVIGNGEYFVSVLPEETLEEMHSRAIPLYEAYLESNSNIEGIRESAELIDEITDKWNSWMTDEMYQGIFLSAAEHGKEYVFEHPEIYTPDEFPEITGYVPLDKR